MTGAKEGKETGAEEGKEVDEGILEGEPREILVATTGAKERKKINEPKKERK